MVNLNIDVKANITSTSIGSNSAFAEFSFVLTTPVGNSKHPRQSSTSDDAISSNGGTSKIPLTSTTQNESMKEGDKINQSFTSSYRGKNNISVDETNHLVTSSIDGESAAGAEEIKYLFTSSRLDETYFVIEETTNSLMSNNHGKRVIGAGHERLVKVDGSFTQINSSDAFSSSRAKNSRSVSLINVNSINVNTTEHNITQFTPFLLLTFPVVHVVAGASAGVVMLFISIWYCLKKRFEF